MAKEAKKSKKGRRFNGRFLKTIDPYMAITPYLMPTRNDAMVNMVDTLDVTDAERFIRQMRTEGMKGLGMLHLFIASYVRAVSQVPQLNRFINGQQLYARTNIEVIMTVKKAMWVDAEETSIKVVFDPRDTLKDVYEKMNAAIDAVKAGEDTSTDAAARIIMALPRWLLKLFMALVRFLDYHGWLPKVLLNASPFHGSMIVTDVGSLGIPPVMHHIYNFGNLSCFTSFGPKYSRNEVGRDGTVVTRRCMDWAVVIDERICDGFTYSKGIRVLKSGFKDPQSLLTPPETVLEDII